MQSVPDHLSVHAHEFPPYRVLMSSRLKLHNVRYGHYLAPCYVPIHINLVDVDVPLRLDVSASNFPSLDLEHAAMEQRKVDFAEILCAGFDMEICGWSLRVTPEFEFNCVASEATLSAVRNRRIGLRPWALVSHSRPRLWGSAVSTGMQRIAKYLERGFTLRDAAQ